MKAPAHMADMDSTANYRLVKKASNFHKLGYIFAMQNIFFSPMLEIYHACNEVHHAFVEPVEHGVSHCSLTDS